jgi:hypothetical protein
MTQGPDLLGHISGSYAPPPACRGRASRVVGRAAGQTSCRDYSCSLRFVQPRSYCSGVIQPQPPTPAPVLGPGALTSASAVRFRVLTRCFFSSRYFCLAEITPPVSPIVPALSRPQPHAGGCDLRVLGQGYAAQNYFHLYREIAGMKIFLLRRYAPLTLRPTRRSCW